MQKYRKPYRLKKKRYFWQNQFFWLGILILIIFGGFFYLIFFHSFFQVKEIKISGNQKVTKESLENLVKAKISQKVLFLPTKSIFLVNLAEINKDILEKFPQIAQVNLDRKFPNAILIQIKERKPVAIFCLTPPNPALNLRAGLGGSATDCFFIDGEGIVFESTEPKPNFFRLKKEMNGEINFGERVIEKETLLKILEIKSKLENEIKIPTEEVLMVSEERFNLKILEGWQIYFNLKEDLDWQLTKLRAVLEKEIPQEKRKNLEYIDLRFGNFAPYKYR